MLSIFNLTGEVLNPNTFKGVFLLEANRRRMEEHILMVELLFGYISKVVESVVVLAKSMGATIELKDIIDLRKTFVLRDLLIKAKDGTLYQADYEKEIEKMKEEVGLIPSKMPEIVKRLHKRKRRQ